MNPARWLQSERARARVALLLLLAVGGALLLLPLEGGAVDPYDEVAAMEQARKMLEAGRFLFTVNDAGEYALAGVTKPPLFFALIAGSIQAFGATLWAARLPSALAALGLALIAFLWARRADPGDGGTVWGLLWGVLILTAEGTWRYAGAACIEPVLSFWAAASLFAFAHVDGERWRRDLGAAAITGCLLGAAFLTKQLAAGIAVLPVVGLAASRGRAGAPRALIGLGVSGAVSMVIAASWLSWFQRTIGEEGADYLFSFSVKQRVGGFEGTRHYNWLNRFSDLGEMVLDPVPLSLGVAALVLVLVRLRGGEARALAVGLLAYTCTAVLVFELVSKSVLEWYAFHLVFPLSGGAAWLLARAARAALREPPRALTLLDGLELGLGAALFAAIADACAKSLYSRAALGLAVGGALVVAGLIAPRLRRGPARVVVVTAGAIFVLLMGGRALRHDHAQNAPTVRAALGRIVDEQGLSRVSVAGDVLGRRDAKAVRERRLRAFFGPGAVVGKAPWEEGGAPADARVELRAIPDEVEPRPGAKLFRGPGGVVFAGDLSAPPIDDEAWAAALERGPLTFRAENLPSSHLRSLRRDGRAIDLWLNERAPRRPLASVPRLILDAGDYVVVFRVAWRCSKLARREHIGTLQAGRAKERIQCEEDDAGSDGFTERALRFSTAGRGRARVLVDYERGELALDTISVWRADRYPGPGEKP